MRRTGVSQTHSTNFSVDKVGLVLAALPGQVFRLRSTPITGSSSLPRRTPTTPVAPFASLALPACAASWALQLKRLEAWQFCSAPVAAHRCNAFAGTILCRSVDQEIKRLRGDAVFGGAN